jgi:hypothetical protein
MYTWVPLESRSDLEALIRAIPSEYEPKRVVDKLISGLSDAVAGVLIEKNYIDKDYRSTYYNFYAKRANPIEPIASGFISSMRRSRSTPMLSNSAVIPKSSLAIITSDTLCCVPRASQR